ncbi:MAG: hypothetical protein ACP5IX_01215 [Patescibacteria group bacterium]
MLKKLELTKKLHFKEAKQLNREYLLNWLVLILIMKVKMKKRILWPVKSRGGIWLRSP